MIAGSAARSCNVVSAHFSGPISVLVDRFVCYVFPLSAMELSWVGQRYMGCVCGGLCQPLLGRSDTYIFANYSIAE